MNKKKTPPREEEFDDLALYHRFRALREEKVDDKLFLVDQDESAIHMLDPMAVAVWQLLADAVCVDDVAAVFREFFPDTDPERIRDDVEDLFVEFESYNLIQVVPAASTTA